jgi:hypothetical protein
MGKVKVNLADTVPHISEMSEGEQHLRAFIGAASAGEPPPAETRDFLVKAFSGILQGKEPKKALKLTLKQGQKGAAARTKRHNEELNLAIRVEQLILTGKTADEARQIVMNEENLKDIKSVRTPHKKHQALARLFVLTDGLQNLDALKRNK